jgi:hypothetical protein
MPDNPNEPPQASAPRPTAGREDAVTALAALYQGEKTDASYVFNTAMVMMGVAVAYLVAGIPFVGSFIMDRAWLLLLLLPIPLWLIAAFHSLMTLNAMSHGISVRIIEDALFTRAELRADRELIGSAAGDKIMDITQSKAVHTITTIVVYVGVAFLVIGFTVYTLHSASAIMRADVALVHARVGAIAQAIYWALGIMVGYSWIEGLRIINKGRCKVSEASAAKNRNVCMAAQFFGSHRVLFRLPIWASAIILYVLMTGAIFVLRDATEGLPYQVAYSAQFGDAALVGAMLIAATILQRGAPLQPWLCRHSFHFLAALVSVGVGILWWSLDHPGHWGDIYHHLFVAPLIVYLAITLLPIVLMNGTKAEKLFVLCFVLSWATLVAFDLTHDRMNQRDWLKAHAVSLTQ